MARKLITEAIGTFFLVLTIGLTVVAEVPMAPLAIGAVLMTMIYMGGHVSGAHYNPAVTIAVLMRGKITAREVGPYIGAQLGGAILAAFAVFWLTGRALVVAPDPDAPAAVVLVAEFLFTFALVMVVLNVATTRRTEGNSYYGLAIGFTVLAGAYAVGAISGGAFNPAVGIGPAIVAAAVGQGGLGAIWYYIVGPVAGAAAAAALFRVQNPEEFVPGAPVDDPAPTSRVPDADIDVSRRRRR
jgi:aquaporin Z